MTGKDTLYGKLKEYSENGCYPFHMPGHKRNIGVGKGAADSFRSMSPYTYDITETDGFDNLHEPEGIIKERMDIVSDYYKSQRSYYLVNGSTCGILAAISAACHREQKSHTRLIMSRNSHKAAYNGVLINGLEVSYIYPDRIKEYGIHGGIADSEVENILCGLSSGVFEERGEKHREVSDVGAVYITSPTYEGIVSDIESISQVCHRYGVPLIVDEAHGAHFGMYEEFPRSALELGADIVIQSLHKTLPSLTQTAILHIAKHSLIPRKEIERYLAIYQSSSPSYVLMASIDRCLDEIINGNKEPFHIWCDRLSLFRKRAEALNRIQIPHRELVGKNNVYDFDISKLLFFPMNNRYSGQRLYDRLLRENRLQMEMASLRYVIAMTSVADTEESFDRLYKALAEADREIENIGRNKMEMTDCRGKMSETVCAADIRLEATCKISEAIYTNKKETALENAEGKIAGDFVYLYPPGIPLVVPGELINREIMEYIKKCISCGLRLYGLGEDGKSVTVVKQQP